MPSDRTCVSGFAARQADQVSITTGRRRKVIPLPARGPTTGLPVNWFHKVCVCRSNISLLDL